VRTATLALAWTKVGPRAEQRGGRTELERFAARSDVYLAELTKALRDGSYHSQPVRRVDIPGRWRAAAAGYPGGQGPDRADGDEAGHRADLEVEFLESSYGFRPGRGCHDALREVDRLIKAGFSHVVDADLAGYFDSIRTVR